MPETRLVVNFARFGSKTEFLTKFLDDSAWFCVEEIKNIVFLQKNIIFYQKNKPGPEESRKSTENFL